jgi:hypothetical protein
MTDNTTMQLIPRQLIDIIEKAGGAERPDLWAPDTEMSELFELAMAADMKATRKVVEAASAAVGVPPETAEAKKRRHELVEKRVAKQMENDPVHLMLVESEKKIAEISDFFGSSPEWFNKFPVVNIMKAHARLEKLGAFRAAQKATS